MTKAVSGFYDTSVNLDNHPIENNSFFPFVDNEKSVIKKDLAYSYDKAAHMVSRFFPVHFPEWKDFTENSLRKWCSSMLGCGIPSKTVRGYLETLSAIYTKAVKKNIASPTGAFKEVKNLFSPDPTDHSSIATAASQASLLRLVRDEIVLTGELRLHADLFLLSFYNMGLPTSTLLSLKEQDLAQMGQEAAAIGRRYLSPRRAKVFPRLHTASTERRILMVLHYLGFTFPDDTDVMHVARALWISAALQTGLLPEIIKACVPGNADEFAVTRVAEKKPLDKPEKEEVIRLVHGHLTDSPAHWYILKLRHNSTFAWLKERIISETGLSLMFYYPQEVITQKIGRRLEFKDKPILPELVFMRCTWSELEQVLASSGDLAWCYRNTRHGDYAIVPDQEMHNFQRALGIFTPDFKIQPLGTDIARIGHKARIIGGEMAGYEGMIYDIVNTVPTSTKLFRLRFPGNNGIEWKVDIDERQIEWLG